MKSLKPLSSQLPKKSNTLNFSDGLNFGAGFWVAGILVMIVGVPMLTCLTLTVLAVLGRHTP